MSASADRSEPLVLYSASDGIAELTLNRLHINNAFNAALYGAVVEALGRAEADPSVLAVIMTGRGRYFSSGADLKDLDPNTRRTADAPVGQFMRCLMRFPKPVVCAVNGPAVGVAVTMLPHCDLAFASETATFWVPFARAALVPEFCSSVLLPLVLGPAVAADMILAGTKLDAQQALSRGLVSAVLPVEGFMDAVRARVRAMVSVPKAARTLALFKRMLRARWLDALDRVFVEEMELLDERIQNGEAFEAVMELMSKRAGSKARSRL